MVPERSKAIIKGEPISRTRPDYLIFRLVIFTPNLNLRSFFMSNNLKGQLFRRFRAGVREHFAKRSVQPRMAARISASCRAVFERAWARGTGQCLVTKKNGKPIIGVAQYGEVVAQYMHNRFNCSDWLDSSSRDEKLDWAAHQKAKQMQLEALLTTIADEEPEETKRLKNSIRGYKSLVTQKSSRWGLEPAEIDEKAAELLALWNHLETSSAENRLHPDVVAEVAEFPQAMGSN
jgi:hypothetical protein